MLMSEETEKILEEIFTLYKTLEKCCKELEISGFELPPEYGYFGGLRNILGNDIADYMAYLSVSDGQIIENEVALLNLITDYNTDVDSIMTMIKQREIYTTSFEKTFPLIVKFMRIADREIARSIDTSLGEATLLSEKCFLLYKYVGALLIAFDGVTDTEIENYNMFMNMLSEYVYGA